MALRSIYQHGNFRTFLKEFYEEKKRVHPHFSYRLFADKAGLQSPNYLKLIIDGDRKLTVANIHRFAKAMDLSHDEHVYFEALVLANQAESTSEQRFYKKRLALIKSQKPQEQVKLTNDKELTAHHLFPAILLSLVGCPPAEAADTVSERYGLPVETVKTVLSSLLRLAIIREKDGLYAMNADHYLFHDPMPNRQQKQFLRQQLELSLQAFDLAYDGNAKFYAHTFTLPRDAYADCVDMITSFLDTLTQKFQDAPPADVVQLNLQFFPLSKHILTKG